MKWLAFFIAVLSACRRTITLSRNKNSKPEVDDYFGTKVSDPYRWLENDTSVETKQWVKTEEQFTQNYLAQIPFRDKIKSVIQKL